MMKTVALALLMVAMTTPVLAKKYIYTNFSVPMDDSDGGFSIRLDISAKLERHGHTGGRLHICAESEDFHCFIMNGRYSFAVPKHGELKVGDHWKYLTSEYSIDAAQSLLIFGVKRDVLIISSPFDSERRDVFYYSPTIGLLAIKFEMKGQNAAQTYFLTGSEGFPF
jgi:hypothetical protein